MNHPLGKFLPGLGWQRISLILIIGSLLFIRSPQQSFAAHDEGYYALQARWIVESGNWLAPQWWGEPVYDRTIGIQWAIAASYKLFGISEMSARLPSNLACAFSVLLTYEIGKILLNQQVAWFAALILSLTAIWIEQGLLAAQDVTLVLIELLGIWAILQSENRWKNRKLWGVVAGSTFGLGFLIKGFMVFLPCVALLPYLILENRRHRHLTNIGIYVGILLGLIPVVGWLGLSWLQYGWLPLQQLFGKLFILGNTAWYPEGPEYYFWNIPANAFPWPLFTLMGVGLTFKQPKINRKWLLLGYPTVLFLELTLFKTRAPYYALQLMPFMAVFAGAAFAWLAKIYRQEKRKTLIALLNFAFGGLGLLVLVVSIAVNLPNLNVALEIRHYSVIAFVLGISWFVLLIIGLSNYFFKKPHFSVNIWLLAWFLGPWLVLQNLTLVGAWGDYNPDIKAFFQQPLTQNIVNNNTVNFVANPEINNIFTGLQHVVLPDSEYDLNEIHKSLVLLSVYTPQLGNIFTNVSEIPINQYAFVSPDQNLGNLNHYREIATVRLWKLIQIKE